MFLEPCHAELLTLFVDRLDEAIRVNQQDVATIELDTSAHVSGIRENPKQQSTVGKRFQLAIRAQQKGGRMSSATVVEPSAGRIKPGKKQARQWHRGHAADIAVNAGNDRFRLASHSSVRTNQSDQMGGPHSGRQTLAADIAQSQEHSVISFFNGEKVTRQVSNSKNFAGDLEVAVTHQARSAKTPVHLRRLKDRGVQLSEIGRASCRERV